MKNEIKIGALIGYLSIAFSTVISLIFIPFLLAKLGDSEYGIYSLTSSVIAYFTILDFGLSSTSIRYISKYFDNEEEKEKINGLLIKVYGIISIIAIILGIIIYFLSPIIFVKLTTYELAKFKISLIIMTITISLSFYFSVYSSFIIANEKFIFQKTIALVQSISKPLLMIPFLILGFKSITMVSIIAAVTLFINIINYLYATKKLNFKIKFTKFSESKSLFKEISKYSFFIMLSTIVDVVIKNTDQVILGAVSGTTAVTIYNLSMQIRSTNSTCSSVISQLFFPKLSKLSNLNNYNEMNNIFNKISRIQLILMTLIASGFIIFGIPFINIWVGKQYIDIYYIVLICMLPNIIPLSQNIGIYILQATNKHFFRSLILFGIAIINVILTIPLAIYYDGIGAAIGTAIAVILGQIIALNIYYHKVIKLEIKKYWQNFSKLCFPIIIISFIISYLIKNINFNLLTLILAISIYIITYITIYYNILMNNYEKNLIKKFIKKLSKKS